MHLDPNDIRAGNPSSLQVLCSRCATPALHAHITASSVVAYEALGPEALYARELERLPAVVIIDRGGRNFHEESRACSHL